MVLEKTSGTRTCGTWLVVLGLVVLENTGGTWKDYWYLNSGTWTGGTWTYGTWLVVLGLVVLENWTGWTWTGGIFKDYWYLTGDNWKD